MLKRLVHTYEYTIENMLMFIKDFLFKSNTIPNDETQMRSEVIKILLQAALFTGLLMGILFLLQYEVEDERPDTVVALFTFVMAFVFTQLVWLFNIYILNLRILPALSAWVLPKYEFILRGGISLIVCSVLMLVWAYLDKGLGMEYRDKPNIIGLMQVRGLIIVAISLTITWGIGQVIAQQRALSLISKLKEENFEAKFEVLKQQINPHFLFNSLNILKGMIRTQNENSELYVIKLAEVYRYVLQSNTRNLVPLAEELTILESYYFMLKSRFREAVDLKIDLSEKVRKTQIPPLTLQILVENCVKHNVVSQAKPLIITIFEETDTIIVSNNLQIKNALDVSNKVGLVNIMQRYSHLTEQKIEVEKTPQAFTVKLPVLI